MVNLVGRVGGTDADGAAHGEVDVASFGRVIGHVQSEVIGPPFRARPCQLAGLVDPGRVDLVGWVRRDEGGRTRTGTGRRRRLGRYRRPRPSPSERDRRGRQGHQLSQLRRRPESTQRQVETPKGGLVRQPKAVVVGVVIAGGGEWRVERGERTAATATAAGHLHRARARARADIGPRMDR